MKKIMTRKFHQQVECSGTLLAMIFQRQMLFFWLNLSISDRYSKINVPDLFYLVK